MTEQKAVYYGEVELIPGIICDGYILDDPDNTAVMSERGTAELLNMDHKALRKFGIKGIPASLKPFWDKELVVGTNQSSKTINSFVDKGLTVRTNWPPKSLESFVDKGLIVRTNLVEVLANNSPHRGRKIVT